MFWRLKFKFESIKVRYSNLISALFWLTSVVMLVILYYNGNK